MPRITPIDPHHAEGRKRELLDDVAAAFGGVPNGVATIAVSTPALEAFVAAHGALARGGLRAAERDQIAIAVAEANGCTYCLSAHTASAEAMEVSAEDRHAARRFEASGDHAQAVLAFAEALVEHRGGIDDEHFDAARDAGLTDEILVEIAAQVGLSTFTNLVNRSAQTTLDVPRFEAEVVAR